MENPPAEATKVNIDQPPPDLPPGHKATAFIDILRELTRSAIAVWSVYYVLWMLYRFVELSQAKDAVVNLVIGGILGFLGGIGTLYFTGLLRSGLATLQQQAKGGGNQ